MRKKEMVKKVVIPPMMEKEGMTLREYQEFQMYCNDTGKNADSLLEQKWQLGEIKLKLKRMPAISKNEQLYFIYTERCLDEMCCYDEINFWVWEKSLTKLDYFLVYYTKEILTDYLYMLGTEEKLEMESVDSLLDMLKEHKNERVLKKLKKIIKFDVKTYDDLVKKAYSLEKFMQELEFEVNFFVFPSFYEARALIHTHGQFDLNDKTISLKTMFKEDGRD